MRPAVRLIAATVPVDDPDYPDSLGLGDALGLIEFAGRWDYGEKSVAKMEGKPEVIIGRWLDTGEESMVEMAEATFLITCSRVVSHELVRHRIASYQQESQRFVSYKDEKAEDLFVVPGFHTLPKADMAHRYPDEIFGAAVDTALEAYIALTEAGVSKQLARYVLPNATRTRVIAKMNLREWRHVLRLRMHTSAQPEIQEVMRMVHAKLQRRYGAVLFPDDIAAERGVR